MESNVGGFDGLVRLIVGAVLMALASIDVLGSWAWLGATLGATGLFRACPVYAALGCSTCRWAGPSGAEGAGRQPAAGNAVSDGSLGGSR